ncbi:UNVERIFIED_CONTAM: SdpI family protein [Halobacillus marinus]|uniref:SdpI family protein n=1 Tax=Halobacillus sp. BAB-2008 TaxID=1246484 RepID=UPI0002A4DDDF|nr:SdpI family protein [Halobacillus sp. BAB-2008]ELK45617.1 integral membrane protein [Halobacillus sp. BAB-2008]
MKKFFVPIAVILVSIVTGIMAYPNMTSEVPIHWNSGEADLFVSKGLAIFVLPILMLVSALTIWLTDKYQGNIDNKKNIYKTHNFSLVILFFIHLMILSFGLNVNVDSNLYVGIIVGIITVALANPMQKTRPNAVYGLRLPWTLNDENVWRKSNRFSGELLFFVGLLIIGMSIVYPEFTTNVILLLLVGALVISVIVSFGIYKKVNNSKA